ncbi:MAG: polysaccharide biosynthesis tyrosine autokinase [Actinomycetota bacterium]|nr:polysaccharide biosynthesis tyrosine autokinase [Actinomycetota bacterium]
MYAVEDKSEVSIQQYVDVLRRRWLWLLIMPVALVGFTLFNDLRATPVYQASTQMLLQAKASESLLNPSAQLSTPERALQNELRLVKSSTVKEAVRKAYGKPIAVSTAAGGDDDVFIITAAASSGAEAARRANVYAQTYQTSRLQALVADIAETQKVVQQQVDDYQKQVDKIDAPLAALDVVISKTDPSDSKYAALVAQRSEVKQRTDAERSSAQSSLDKYKDSLNQLSLVQRINTTGGVQVLNPAVVPSAPVSPTVFRDVLQALAIGLFIGIAAAFVRDQLDDSLRTKDDVERAVKDLTTIGLIPFDPSWRDPRVPNLVTVSAPMSAIAESYRGLRTAIQYAALDQPLKIIQVTSAGAGEGKTSMLANLALAFAQAGKRVAVVGCDLRKPRLHQFMEVDGKIGFTSVVLGDLTLDEALQQSPLHPNIDVLASGPRPPNPSELLSIDRAAAIIASLRDRYSIVFIDCPPVLPVTDALVLSRCVDGTIFLAAANKTTRRTARHAVELLRQVGSPLLGTVLNGVAAEDTYGSFYEYYGYLSRSRIPLIGKLFHRHRKGSEIPSLDEGYLPPEGEARTGPGMIVEKDEERPVPGKVEVRDEQETDAESADPSDSAEIIPSR